ncbi:MAG: GTP-binding protein [Alteromonadaceae bacterium]|nr:GTP-binding protein [Alteromonadaceae bacterium]
MLIEKPIPTNIITGFLGTGKTTVIQHLLRNKPKNERWAILVNEFGEIGVDGDLIETNGNSSSESTSDNQEIFIKEVPGGCMCCTAGLPMQIALNQLIAKAIPDRLIIEPTGLGHPKEVLAELCSAHNKDVIQLNTIITLFDAHKLVQPKYHEHAIYKEQLEVADLLVANKSDLLSGGDMERMQSQLLSMGLQEKSLEIISFGQLQGDWLDKPSNFEDSLVPHHHHHRKEESLPQWKIDLETNGRAYTQQARDGFITEGWIFNSNHVFDFDKLFHLISSLSVERIKGIFITNRGVFGFNQADGIVSSQELDESANSRVELIRKEGLAFDKNVEAELNFALLT